MRVLIVEDDYLIALGLETIIEQFGFEVCAIATSIPAALAALERERPDCVTVDVRLNRGECGVEVAQAAWTNWHIPSLFISGNIDEGLRRRTASLAPLGYLDKPVKPAAIHRALKELGDRRMAAGEDAAIPHRALAS